MATRKAKGMTAAQRAAIVEMRLMSRGAKRQPTHGELLTARAALGKPRRGDPLHQRLAAAEHEAFARETVEQHPLRALPMLAMTPGYSLLKRAAQATGLDKRYPYFGGTSPDLGQLAAGYRGIRSGLRSAFGLEQSTRERLALRDRPEGREVLAVYKPKRKKRISGPRIPASAGTVRGEDRAMNSKAISHMEYDG